MGDYQYLMENSGSNYLPNNSVKNTDEFQKYTNLNNMDYYTAEISNQGSTFKEAMNINDENKKNMYKTEVEVNKINNESTQNQNNNQNEYMGQIHEEYGYNQQGEEGDNEQYDNEEYVEGDEEQMEKNNEQQGEEYEEFQEEQYNYEEQYEEGNYGEEEQIEQMEEYHGEEGDGEEEVENKIMIQEFIRYISPLYMWIKLKIEQLILLYPLVTKSEMMLLDKGTSIEFIPSEAVSIRHKEQIIDKRVPEVWISRQ